MNYLRLIAVFFGIIGVVFGRYDGAMYTFRVPDPSQPEDTLAHAYFLKDAASRDGAVCIDGTPSAYYFRPGSGSGANKWYLHMQGGGWCESYADCYARSLTDLGSSKNYPQTLDLGGGYFSQDPKINPQMYNWNSVLMRYCDGGSFSGDNATVSTYKNHNLFFRGHRILEAMFHDLFENRGLKSSTDVVVSGCSAGGLATFLHVDWWHDRLPKTAKVVGLPDSGFFLDYESDKHYHTGMIWVFETMNATSGVNEECIKAHEHTKDTWKCFFAQHTAPFIKTPIFPLQAEYDSWQTANDLDSTNSKVINDWGKNLTALVKETILNRPQNGIFLDSCFHHCGKWGSIKIDGEVQATAFQNFYEGKSKHNDYFQSKTYPCSACCSA